MNIIFEPSITLGSMVHLVVLVALIWIVSRNGLKRLRGIEAKQDELLKVLKILNEE